MTINIIFTIWSAAVRAVNKHRIPIAIPSKVAYLRDVDIAKTENQETSKIVAFAWSWITADWKVNVWMSLSLQITNSQ